MTTLLSRSHAALALIPLLPLSWLSGCGDNLPASGRGLSISGYVWNDSNGNGSFDEGEEPIAGSLIYLDQSQDDILDPSEASVLSDPSGFYSFAGLPAGEYAVKQDLEFGWRPSVGSALSAPSKTPEGSLGQQRAHIIGGSDTESSSYAFMVSVGRGSEGGFSHFCGGVLVSERFVVTAAHCSEGQEAAEVAVLLGADDPSEGGHQVDVRAITIHPDYNGDTEDGYDIAVWELDERVDLEGLGVNTVEMLGPGNDLLATPSLLATAIGWGVSDNPSNLLQEVHVPIVSEEQCGTSYPQVSDFSTQICAGALLGGLDSCQGDSGGPLLVRDPVAEVWMHAGVTSWGDGCALAGKPGLYARSSALSEWALSLMDESSSAYSVDLRSNIGALGFPNQPTVRPLVGELAPRWALGRTELVGVEDGAIPANSGYTTRFFVFADRPDEDQVFDCVLDSDGAGPLEGDAFSCRAGVNSIGLGGYPDGVYLPELRVQSAGRTQTRKDFIRAGTPEQVEVVGTLSVTDETDPDFPNTYYIDHYAISDLAPGVVSVVEVEASFGLQIAVYDAAERSSADGGGTVELGVGGLERSIHFVPEEGKTYLVGVSSSGSLATGDYTFRLLNNGIPTATNL